MSYDFMTLSPNDFEGLVADLLSKSWNLRLESFKQGKDSGIDLRHSLSPDGTGALIVQCKRYAPSKVTELLRSLKAERTKLEALQPSRYVVATTVGLSPENKESILNLLTPWVKSDNDIYGPEELNQLLRTYPEIVGSHFKLWISSTAVLERVLNARIFAQTEATIDATRIHASKLVIHAGLNKALDLLQERHHVLIVGNPGIGKTTLARMLMCHYIENDFEPVWVVGNVQDAWTVIHSAVGSDRKFVVVYDDFLGRLQFSAEKFEKNEDVSLLALLDRAAKLPNVRLILTTREYILADAKKLHGAFEARADEIVKYTLSLALYARKERAHILFNHLYFSDLPDTRLQRLIETKAYEDVIRHEHFNPRIVESVSTFANSQAMTDDEYVDFFKLEFDNPAKLWERPFNREISSVARQIMAVLWSFNGQADLLDLEQATYKIAGSNGDYESKLEFEDAIRQLDGNFISTDRFSERGQQAQHIIVQFQNPSVEEFVEKIATEVTWLRQLLQACITINQVSKISEWVRKKHPTESFLLRSLREKAIEFEDKPSGKLINYWAWRDTQARRVWEIELPLRSSLVLLLLLHEQDTNIQDARRAAVHSEVLTDEGWKGMLAVIPNDMNAAFSVLKLQRWIVEESEWPLEQITQADIALRNSIEALLLEITNWPIDLGSLDNLAEAAALLHNSLSPSQVTMFTEAGLKSANSTLESNQDSYSIREEIDGLQRLEERLKTNFSIPIDQLINAAESYEENDDDRSTPSDKKRYDQVEEELDVDGLFLGLTDR